MLDKTISRVKIITNMKLPLNHVKDQVIRLSSPPPDTGRTSTKQNNPNATDEITIPRDHAMTLAQEHPLTTVLDTVMGLRKGDRYHPSIATGLMNNIELDKLSPKRLTELFEKIISIGNDTYANYLAGNPSLHKIADNDLDQLAKRFILEESSFFMPQELLKEINLRKINPVINRLIFEKTQTDQSLRLALETNQRKHAYTLNSNGSVSSAS